MTAIVQPTTGTMTTRSMAGRLRYAADVIADLHDLPELSLLFSMAGGGYTAVVVPQTVAPLAERVQVVNRIAEAFGLDAPQWWRCGYHTPSYDCVVHVSTPVEPHERGGR